MPHELDCLARGLRQAQDARDAQDTVRRIRLASSALVTPGPSLVKRAIAWNETDLTCPRRSVSQYGVLGLPRGERAIIMKFGHIWKTLHFRDEHPVSDWESEHLDADAALAALNQSISIAPQQSAGRIGRNAKGQRALSRAKGAVGGDA
jgi:hypothetical protein